ncbi:NDP-hexose 2,3-dehydratase family protein [Frankia sp. AiPs1]|uniref:NDP-hexose 2,3-dehydratase family protein n=1 Tax=Frankia sp. AiPs1 TaxID=573493 RepID=UPI0020433874|nr:NDP-hexose 2,3-dehydratase family protein [Frankia sp. AiPs1]MCM3921336.1 NDP-hexose 2,3-dehydratase family protein [Frankia sp. AiPs1]
MFGELSEFHTWFEQRKAANTYHVSIVGLDNLDGWEFDPDSGNLRHRSGKFFSVEGIEVTTDHREVSSWSQPIILQPEIGILGVLVKRFDGVPHCLMQAKMEPGNINLLQLSPTVQATRSNYTRVHRGNAVPYLQHFLAPRHGRVAFDALQSEQGSWFLNKRNRNMIVEVEDDVPVLDDFCWLSTDQLRELVLAENLVNMDSRTVLSGLPLRTPGDGDGDALHTTQELLSWFTEAKAQYLLERRLVRLVEVKNWIRSNERISHELDLFFQVIGIHVQASNREVARWSQPMFRPTGRGVIAFVAKWVKGTMHLLVHARTEPGTGDVVEMSSTVNCDPDNYREFGADQRPQFLDLVLSTPPERVLIDVVHSEEGGRFYHAENRYQVVLASDDLPLDVPPDFTWMTVDQLSHFVRYGNHVNVGARSLLTCLTRSRAITS